MSANFSNNMIKISCDKLSCDYVTSCDKLSCDYVTSQILVMSQVAFELNKFGFSVVTSLIYIPLLVFTF